MRTLALARTSLTRLARDRTTLFFTILLPVLVILLVGATVGGFEEFRIGLVDQGSGELGAELADDLAGAGPLVVDPYDDLDDARTALRRTVVDAVVLLPAGMDADLRAGEDVEVTVLAEQANTTQQAALAAISSVVADHAAEVQAAVFASEQVGGDVATNLELVAEVSDETTPITVDTETVDAESDFLPLGFDYSAPTMLVLFVFINSLAGGAALIQNRQLGIHERMLSGPVTTRTIVGGETLVYLAFAVLQSALIVVVGALVFGVDWGDPAAATVLVLLWALVGTGAGMLSGTVFRTEEQATSIGPPVGVAFGMLGGCMWPLEIVPPVMQTIGHLTPHAWAVDAWIELLSRGGGIAQIGTELAVLTGFAVGMLALASLRLQHRLAA